MTAAQLEKVLDSRTVPSRAAPPTNDVGGLRHGRPFTLRLEMEQEDKLRRELARLELLPFNERPQELFGYNGGRRRASLGWFMVWAALQYCAGKTAARPSTRPTGKTRRKPKRAGRRPAKRSGKKGGRR